MTIIDNAAHHEMNAPPPSDRKFGLLFAGVFLLLGLMPLVVSRHVVVWPWVAGGLFLVASLACPALLGPLNRLWMKFGELMHGIVSPMVLGLMFFLVITPIGLLMRVLGKRPIPAGFDREAQSYWIKRDPAAPASGSMRNQF